MVDKSAVSRGLQEPNLVFPLGVIVPYFLIHVLNDFIEQNNCK